VTQAVGQMDEVTQQNAALVEQAAAAAESLEEQARSLVQAVAMFKLDDSPRSTPGVPGPALRDATPRALPGRTPAQALKSGGARKLPPAAATSLDEEWEEF
jgi:methyl-accepting chemotaxis protein